MRRYFVYTHSIHTNTKNINTQTLTHTHIQSKNTKHTHTHTHSTHVSPGDLGVDLGGHVSRAVLLLQLGVVGGQPGLQGGALLVELLGQRQSLLQVLLALRHLVRRGHATTQGGT